MRIKSLLISFGAAALTLTLSGCAEPGDPVKPTKKTAPLPDTEAFHRDQMDLLRVHDYFMMAVDLLERVDNGTLTPEYLKDRFETIPVNTKLPIVPDDMATYVKYEHCLPYPELTIFDPEYMTMREKVAVFIANDYYFRSPMAMPEEIARYLLEQSHNEDFRVQRAYGPALGATTAYQVLARWAAPLGRVGFIKSLKTDDKKYDLPHPETRDYVLPETLAEAKDYETAKAILDSINMTAKHKFRAVLYSEAGPHVLRALRDDPEFRLDTAKAAEMLAAFFQPEHHHAESHTYREKIRFLLTEFDIPRSSMNALLLFSLVDDCQPYALKTLIDIYTPDPEILPLVERMLAMNLPATECPSGRWAERKKDMAGHLGLRSPNP